jgi:SP family galactose:H+ symporter-like MFS transporter
MINKKEKLSFSAWLAVVTVCIGGFLFGFHVAVVSGVLCCLNKTFNLSLFEEGFVVSVLLLGACFGSACAGFFSDRFGRKMTIIGTALLFTFGAAATAFASDLSSLVWGRFVTGIAVGLISMTVPLYLAEIAPPSRRGFIVSLNQFIGNIGIFAAYAVNAAFKPTDDWRAMFAFGMIPSALLLIGMLFLPDTPEWLFAHKGETAAKKALRLFRRDRLWEDHVKEMKTAASPRKDFSWRRFLEPGVKLALLIGIGLSVFQQITGINAIIYFSPKIFQSAGYDLDSTAVFATMGIGAINVIATCFAIQLLDRAGRRPLLLISLVGMIVALSGLVCAFYFQMSWIGPLAMFCLMTYVSFFSLGLGPVPWLMNAEIFPLSVRGKAMSIAVASNWLFNFLIAQTFLSLVKFMGSAGVFLLFAIFSILALIFVRRFVPETKGKSLEEIELQFAKSRR